MKGAAAIPKRARGRLGACADLVERLNDSRRARARGRGDSDDHAEPLSNKAMAKARTQFLHVLCAALAAGSIPIVLRRGTLSSGARARTLVKDIWGEQGAIAALRPNKLGEGGGGREGLA